MTPEADGRTILVLAPMPPFPTIAGNRRRLLAVCEMLWRGGFAVDFAYYAHEDQVYRRFGQHPPTDHVRMAQTFRRVFRIEPPRAIPLKTGARVFGIDDWCPDAVGEFIARYFARHPDTCTIVVNYVFLSRCLDQVPPGVLKLIDTHDRFADRQMMYRPFGIEPSFFYTDRENEAAGLARADVVLAIQSNEAAYFSAISDKQVLSLTPRLPRQRPSAVPLRIRRMGFIGHGNDANLLSIQAFARLWGQDWAPGMPDLLIAGEIGKSLGFGSGPGVRVIGPVSRLEDFYHAIDVVVAPMLIGTGLKMKVAEAMSFGVPVIGTAMAFDGFAPQADAHRLSSVEAVRDTVLGLRNDAAGLAALASESDALFVRFDAASEEAEASCLAVLRACPAGAGAAPAAAPEAAGLPSVTACLGPVTVTCEHSLRSHIQGDDALGALVLTESGPEHDAAYSPLRGRWFARAAKPGDGPSVGREAFAGIVGDARPSLSNEWVRTRSLPGAVREALSLLLVGAAVDWTSVASLVGRADGRIDVRTHLPSFLLTGEHPAALFLTASAGNAAVECAFWSAMPLQRPLRLPHRGSPRIDLALVPAVLTLEAADADRGRADRIEPGRVLFLTDDLVGRIEIPSGRP